MMTHLLKLRYFASRSLCNTLSRAPTAAKAHSTSRTLLQSFRTRSTAQHSVWNLFKSCKPALFAIGAVVAVSASNDDDSGFDFDSWLEHDVAPSKTSMDEVFDAILEKGRQLSVSQLISNFPSLNRALCLLASQKMASGEYDEALKVLDGQWELAGKAEAVFKFPREIVRSLSLESQIHGERGDLRAAERCNRALWKVLKQYEWLEEENELKSLRARISASLALSAALKDDCLAAEYYIGDAVHYARQVVVSQQEGDAEYAEQFASDIMRLLKTCLQAYFYLKYYESSKCRNTFKRSAKAAYDVVFAVEPKAVPHWKDLKRNAKDEMKHQYESEVETLKRYQSAERKYNAEK